MTTPLDTVPQAKEASVADTTDALLESCVEAIAANLTPQRYGLDMKVKPDGPMMTYSDHQRIIEGIERALRNPVTVRVAMLRGQIATPAGSASGEDAAKFVVYRLRKMAQGGPLAYDAIACDEAADTINALQAEVARAREMNRALADDLCAAEAEAARLRELLRDTTAVAITMLFDTHRADVKAAFSVDELHEVVEISRPLCEVNAQVEAIYRRSWDAIQGSANGQG